MTNYDITFCTNKDCNQKCERNLKNIDKIDKIKCRLISIQDFKDCKFFKK